MNIKEHITVVAAEEAVEVSEVAYELGKTALRLSKDFHKALRFGFGDTDPISGKTKLEMLGTELNDLYACIEMLQDRGVVIPNLGDRTQIDIKKHKVTHYIDVAKKLGTVSPTFQESQEPETFRSVFQPIQTNPLFASRFRTMADRHNAILELTKKLNPIKQEEFAKDLYENIKQEVLKVFPIGSLLAGTDMEKEKMLGIKTEVLRDFLRNSKHYTMINKKFLDLLDVDFDLSEKSVIKFVPNNHFQDLMIGIASVDLCIAEFRDDMVLHSLWLQYKSEIETS